MSRAGVEPAPYDLQSYALPSSPRDAKATLITLSQPKRGQPQPLLQVLLLQEVQAFQDKGFISLLNTEAKARKMTWFYAQACIKIKVELRIE